MKLNGQKYLDLLREITFCQFKLKDQSTFFGFFWSFLHPLLFLSVLFFFFKFRMGEDIEHYGVFLLIGVIHYLQFATSTSTGMSVLYANRNLTCDVILPKEVLVIGSVLANSIEFIMSMLICVLIACFMGIKLSGALIILSLVFVLQVMMVLIYLF